MLALKSKSSSYIVPYELFEICNRFVRHADLAVCLAICLVVRSIRFATVNELSQKDQQYGSFAYIAIKENFLWILFPRATTKFLQPLGRPARQGCVLAPGTRHVVPAEPACNLLVPWKSPVLAIPSSQPRLNFQPSCPSTASSAKHFTR